MHYQDHILDAIGNTPLVELRRIVPTGSGRIAKLESANPTGSTKDRLARTLIEQDAFRLPDAFSDEKRWTMRAYGAEITDVPSGTKKITKESRR